jgi:hypothetical protein
LLVGSLAGRLASAALRAAAQSQLNALLDRAYAQTDPWLSTHLGPSFIFEDLRSDPRFIDLHRRVFGDGLAV